MIKLQKQALRASAKPTIQAVQDLDLILLNSIFPAQICRNGYLI